MKLPTWFMAAVTLGTTLVSGNTYSWSPAASLSAPNIAMPVANPPTTTIYTLTVTDGNGCSATDAVTVTVTTIPTPVVTITGNVLSSNAVAGNQWYKDGQLIAGATARQYTATSNGNYSVRVTQGNCTSAFSNSINYTTTAINSPDLDQHIFTGPNPSTGILFISYKGQNPGHLITVMDMNGKRLLSRNMAGATLSIDINNLAAGAYILQIRNNRTGEQVQRMLVRN